MSATGMFVGYACDVENLRSLNDKLNAKVVEQINNTQELVMLNNFAHESNEYLFKQSLKERMSDIASWRWVLVDLNKRLEEAIATLHHEHDALRVVVQRIQSEIEGHSREGSRPGVLTPLSDSVEDAIIQSSDIEGYSCEESRPGALTPLSDSVEDAIIQEVNFLREQKKKFERMIPDLNKQIKVLTKTNKGIENDILNKQRALIIDESCNNADPNSERSGDVKKKRKRASPLVRWENRCEKLKRAGIRALSNAIIIRQQVRGARVHLSIAAQAYAARVDSALRRRLHANKLKLQDLNWQKDEAVKDYKALDEELTAIEQNILKTMEQERIIEARLADRGFKPPSEHTRDNVDRKLRDELGRLKCFCKHLRNNYERIRTLQHSLTACISNVSCCAEDIIQVVCLDEERIRFRLGEETDSSLLIVAQDSSSRQTKSAESNSRVPTDVLLPSISEEDEDDYPFNC